MSKIGHEKLHSDDAEIFRSSSCFSLVAAVSNFAIFFKSTFFRSINFFTQTSEVTVTEKQETFVNYSALKVF